MPKLDIIIMIVVMYDKTTLSLISIRLYMYSI